MRATDKPKHNTKFVSVKTLAELWDFSRILDEAGVEAFYFGRGRNGARRYLKADVDRFLQELDRA